MSKREFEIKPELEKILAKLYKKDRGLYLRLISKIEEVIKSDCVEKYKHLRYNMKESQRVHIGPFVLVFSYDKSTDFLSFEHFEHHDKIYRA